MRAALLRHWPRLRVAALRCALRARTWALRFVASFWMLSGFMPAPLLLVWLEWLHESMAPDHPGMGTVLHEIAEVQDALART